MRLARWAALASVVALAIGGCTTSSSNDREGSASLSGVTIDSDKVTDVPVSDQWNVRVPPGAAPDGAAMSAHRLDPADLAAVTPDIPGVQLLQAADVTLSSGQPAAPLTFTYHLDQPLPEGSVLYVVDDTANSATVTAAANGSADPSPAMVHVAEMSPDRMTGTVTVDHLSLKTWFQARAEGLANFAANATDLLGHFTDQRTDPPDCPGPYPSWMTQLPVFLDDQNAPMRVCVERDGNNPDIAVVKVANNRGGLLRITSPVTPSWAWQSMFGSDVKSWMNDMAWMALRSVGVKDEELSRSWLLPPGAQLHIGFSQQAVAGQNPLAIRAHMPLAAAAGGLLYSVLDLAESSNSVYALALFGVCAQSSSAAAADNFDAPGLAEAVVKFAGCVVGNPQGFLDLLKSQLPSEVWSQLAPTAKSLLSKAKARLGPVLAIGQIAFVAMDLVATLATNVAGAWTITLYPPVQRRSREATTLSPVRPDQDTATRMRQLALAAGVQASPGPVYGCSVLSVLGADFAAGAADIAVSWQGGECGGDGMEQVYRIRDSRIVETGMACGDCVIDLDGSAVVTDVHEAYDGVTPAGFVVSPADETWDLVPE